MKLKLSLPKTIKPNFELDKLGVDPSLRDMDLNSMQFPSVLPSRYMMLWEEFIDTQAVKELYGSYKKPVGLMYCALAFVSYIANIDSVKYYDVQEFSRKCINAELANYRKKLQAIFQRKLFNKLPLVDVEVQVADTYNEVVRGFYPVEAQLYLVLGNNKNSVNAEDTFGTRRRVTTLSEELHKYSSYMFGNSKPPEYLLGDKNRATGKRKFTKQRNLKAIKHFDWNLLGFDGLKAYAIRLDENRIALRFPIEIDMLYFTSSDRPSVVKSRIEYQIKQAMRKLK